MTGYVFFFFQANMIPEERREKSKRRRKKDCWISTVMLLPTCVGPPRKVQIDASNTSIEVVVWPPSDSSCTA
jgi:hypothetical protein